MKQTTKNILNILNNEVLLNRLNTYLKSEKNPVRQETSVKEAIELFFYMKDVLIEVCETELIEKLSFGYRNNILNGLNNIFNYRNNYSNVISHIENLQNLFYSYGIESLLRNRDFSKELQDAVREKQEYRDVSNTLRKGLRWVKEIEPKLQRIRDLEKETGNSKEIIESNEKVTNDAKAKVLEAQKEIDNKKVIIENTFESAESIRRTLKETDNNLVQIEGKYKNRFESFVEELKKKNSDVKNENIDIQKKVKELLQGATGGKLHEGFIKRKEELQRTLNIWLLGIILLNLLIIFISYSLVYGIGAFKIGGFIINDNLKMGFSLLTFGALTFFIIKKYVFQQHEYVLRTPQIITTVVILIFLIIVIFEGINIPMIDKIDFGSNQYLTPLIKLLITIPLIVLDWFLIKEYSYRKDFVEKYTFKSAISLSLFAYKELLEKEINNTEALKFINNSIEKIYKDPFDNGKYTLAKKEKDLLESLVDVMAGKIVKKAE